jgi:electron transfer flavoprotein alpha subunit
MTHSMLAVIAVRDGVLPAGADETIAECGGRVILVGSSVSDAEVCGPRDGAAPSVRTMELGQFHPGRWARAIAPLIAGETVVVLPGSPDGRDLAPRLAAVLARPLLAGAISISPQRIVVVRAGGAEVHTHAVHGPVIATLQPGVRGVEVTAETVAGAERITAADPLPPHAAGTDVEVLEVLGPDLATIDLSEAPRIIGGGAGLDGIERFEQLGRIAEHLGAALGATRVVTDRGWIEHSKQIGTTGVIVDPTLYISFGVSGAVQHTSGLGTPEHIISVNTDPHCPMMQLSDLAIVADANATIAELDRLLERETGD